MARTRCDSFLIVDMEGNKELDLVVHLYNLAYLKVALNTPYITQLTHSYDESGHRLWKTIYTPTIKNNGKL